MARAGPHPVFEYGSIPRAKLGPGACRDLQRLDATHARRFRGETIFDWTLLESVRAKSWVGVIEAPGASVEILPKVATGPDGDRALARRNLVVMLEAAGAIRSADRALAALQHDRTPLLDVLVVAFADHLVGELERGPHRTYVRREENLAVLRGKLLVGRDAVLNRGIASRVYVEFDELVTDSPLNRVLRAACELLVRRVRSSVAADLLERALLYLAEVPSVRIGATELAAVTLDRTNERFREALTFARLVLSGEAPLQSAGDARTFSILFPMERVFEAYVANLLARGGDRLGLPGSRVRIQAGGKSLAEDEHGRKVLALCPDVLIEDRDRNPLCILDTKWKALLSDDEDRRNGVGRADLHQLFAYATRYRCPRNVLLYPRVAGVTPRVLRDPDSGRELRVAMLDLGRDLRRERAAVVDELRSIVGGVAVKSAS